VRSSLYSLGAAPTENTASSMVARWFTSQSRYLAINYSGFQALQQYWFVSFLVSLGGVWLSPLGTWATNWPIVPDRHDRWCWMWSSQWNENWQGKQKYSEKTYLNATLPTTNPTWLDLGSNPGRRVRKQATNRLSYDTAILICLVL
jgi:hypothetical protein